MLTSIKVIIINVNKTCVEYFTFNNSFIPMNLNLYSSYFIEDNLRYNLSNTIGPTFSPNFFEIKLKNLKCYSIAL